MTVAAVLESRLQMDTRKFEAGSKRAKSTVKGLRGHIDSQMAGIATGIAAAFSVQAIVSFGKQAAAALIDLGKESFALYEVQRKAEAQLEQVIKSTGGAAGVSAQQVKDLAAAFQQTTDFGNELTIRAGAILATFTQIGSRVFPAALKSALDLSAALGQDLQSSVVQIGKALNDPIAGITALKRVGVSFTEQQKEQIKSFVEMNDIVSAQKVILEELQKEFGGAAEATSNSVTQMSNALGDLKEKLGEVLSPAVTAAAKELKALLELGSGGGKAGETLGSTELEKLRDQARKDREGAGSSLLGTIAGFGLSAIPGFGSAGQFVKGGADISSRSGLSEREKQLDEQLRVVRLKELNDSIKPNGKVQGALSAAILMDNLSAFGITGTGIFNPLGTQRGQLTSDSAAKEAEAARHTAAFWKRNQGLQFADPLHGRDQFPGLASAVEKGSREAANIEALAKTGGQKTQEEMLKAEKGSEEQLKKLNEQVMQQQKLQVANIA